MEEIFVLYIFKKWQFFEGYLNFEWQYWHNSKKVNKFQSCILIAISIFLLISAINLYIKFNSILFTDKMKPRFYNLAPADYNNQDVPRIDGLVRNTINCWALNYYETHYKA